MKSKQITAFKNIRVLPSGYQVAVTRAGTEFSRHFAGLSKESLRNAERYRDKLDEISLRLVKEETLDGATFDAMLGLTPVEPVSGIPSQGIASMHLADRKE